MRVIWTLLITFTTELGQSFQTLNGFEFVPGFLEVCLCFLIICQSGPRYRPWPRPVLHVLDGPGPARSDCHTGSRAASSWREYSSAASSSP